jgi:hypothetical protein
VSRPLFGLQGGFLYELPVGRPLYDMPRQGEKTA